MICPDFTLLIQQTWDYLFAEYGFNILFCKEGERDSVILFAESFACRVRFLWMESDNELGIAFGLRNAPLDWSPEENNPLAKEAQWFELSSILGYLEYNPEKLHNQNEKTMPAPRKTDADFQLLETLARRAEPYMAQILAWFEDDDKYYRFRLGYGNYRTWGGRF